LIHEILIWAGDNNFSRVQAEVQISNSRALRFYKKCGFVESGDQATRADSSVLLTKDVEKISAGNPLPVE
jgi:RimJ/RimL family protein N-acetyltransferase